MKSFIIALILLALMLTAVIGNHLYINKVTTEMEKQLSALPDVGYPNCNEYSRDVLGYWEQYSSFVSLSVNYTIVDRVSEHATTLVACAECGDLYGFRTALALLQDAVEDVRRLERLW